MLSCGLKVLVHMSSLLVKCSIRSTSSHSKSDASDDDANGNDECAYDGRVRIDSLKQEFIKVYNKDVGSEVSESDYIFHSKTYIYTTGTTGMYMTTGPYSSFEGSYESNSPRTNTLRKFSSETILLQQYPTSRMFFIYAKVKQIN